MDQIEFVPHQSTIGNYLVVDVFINGFNLINLVSTEEHSLFPLLHVSAHPGQYEGLRSVGSLPPKQHFWGIADNGFQKTERRVAVLESGRSGRPNEWTVSVEICVDGEKVVWQGLRHEQLNFFYEGIPPYYFDLVAYKNALYQFQ